MNPNNMSDEELDRLFRKSTESFDPPYDPEVWAAMEKKLDRLEGGYPLWRKLLYPLLILLVPGAVLIGRLAKVPNTVLTNTPQLLPSNEVPQIIHETEKTKTLPSESIQRRHPPIDIEHKQTGIALKQTDAGKTHETRYNPVENRQVAGPVEDALLLLDPPLAARKTQLVNSSSASLYLKKSVAVQNPVGKQMARADSSRDKHYPESEKRSVFLSSLQIALAVAPDVSTVKFRNPDAISMNAGMLLGIPITDRLSVVTGMLWANKVYGADPENYAPTDDYWQGKKLPSTIDATCKVLDIPINIRYKVLAGERNEVAVQAGLSSYMMLNEEYTYNYTYSPHPYNKTKEYSNQNKHWFGVQNVSVSYNRKLSPYISVGVEPFAKVPLSGIGAGNVKLTSAGIFLTAAYTIQLKR